MANWAYYVWQNQPENTEWVYTSQRDQEGSMNEWRQCCALYRGWNGNQRQSVWHVVRHGTTMSDLWPFHLPLCQKWPLAAVDVQRGRPWSSQVFLYPHTCTHWLIIIILHDSQLDVNHKWILSLLVSPLICLYMVILPVLGSGLGLGLCYSITFSPLFFSAI